MASERYREKNDVHLPILRSLETLGRYQEIWGDPEATGARVDSVGVLDGLPTAIEFKVSVAAGDAWFEPNGAWSVEAKLSGTLLPLYGGQMDPVSSAIRASGFGERPLTFVLAASRYADGVIDELEKMLIRRSNDWIFRYQVWRWDGSQIDVLLNGGTAISCAWPEIQLPRQVPRSKPRVRLGLEGMRQALGPGRSSIFDDVIETACRRGWKIVFVGRSAVVRVGGTPIATIYATDGTAHSGLIVGVDRSRGMGSSPEALPGTEVVGKGVGHRDITRSIRSAAQFVEMVNACGHGQRSA